MKQYVNVRCCNCNKEFELIVDISDKISEIKCEDCGKESIELNLGKRSTKNYEEKRNQESY
jgi:DNA-directed RNA polymerase subunit RPC12/RpoP